MEVPAPQAGTVKELRVKIGDRVSEGTAILLLEGSEAKAAPPSAPAPKAVPAPAPAAAAPGKPAASPAPAPSAPAAVAPAAAPLPAVDMHEGSVPAHASPGVRRFARELGVDLGRVKGSGPKSRILKEDIQGFVKQSLAGGGAGAPA